MLRFLCHSLRIFSSISILLYFRRFLSPFYLQFTNRTTRRIRYQNPLSRTSIWLPLDESLNVHVNEPPVKRHLRLLRGSHVIGSRVKRQVKRNSGARVHLGDILGFTVGGDTNPVPFADMPGKVLVINGDNNGTVSVTQPPVSNLFFQLQANVGT